MQKTQNITYTITNPTELAQFFNEAQKIIADKNYFMHTFMVYIDKIKIDWLLKEDINNLITLVWKFEKPEMAVAYIDACRLIISGCMENHIRYALPTFIGLDDVNNETPNMND